MWCIGKITAKYPERMNALCDLFLFFLHLGSRRVCIAGCTPQPHGA